MKKTISVIIVCILAFSFLTMSAGAYSVFLKLPSGTDITIEVAPTDTVAYIKQALNDREGYPVDELRLFFNGFEMLFDDATLADYNVQKEATITVALRGESLEVTVKVGGQPGTSSVYGSYAAGAEAGTVYSVDITWGAMEFTYTGASEGEWDPESHTYIGQTDAAWSVDDTDGNKITIINHSNAEVTATLTYEKKTGFTDINGSFTEDSETENDGILILPSAEGSEVSEAPTETVNFNLSGALDSGSVSKTVIGTIKITLS